MPPQAGNEALPGPDPQETPDPLRRVPDPHPLERGAIFFRPRSAASLSPPGSAGAGLICRRAAAALPFRAVAS